MHIERRFSGALLGMCLLAFAAPARGAEPVGQESVWQGPLLVSPGGRGEEGRVSSGCPGFNWAAVQGAAGYEVVVYEVSGPDASRKPAEEAVLRVELPAGASGWTPELGECLAPGRYGWAVGAIEETGAGRATRWSRPALFRVERSGPTRARWSSER